MFSKKELSRFVVVIVAIIFLLILYLVVDVFRQKAAVGQINSFEDCVRAGNPVMESYPRQCRAEDGRLFVEEIDDPVQVPGEDSGYREIPRGNDREPNNSMLRTQLFDCLHDAGANQFENSWTYPQENKEAIVECNERYPFYTHRRQLFNY